MILPNTNKQEQKRIFIFVVVIVNWDVTNVKTNVNKISIEHVKIDTMIQNMRKSYFLMFKSWWHHHFFFTWCTPRFQCWSCIILWFPVQLSTLYRRLQHVFSERVSLSLSHLAGLKISPDATILMRMLTSMFYNAYILRQWMNPKEISSVSTKPDILPPSSKTQQCIVKQVICILRKKKIIQWMCCTLTNVCE